MKHNKKRISKIIDELTTYFLNIGSNEIHIDVKNHFKYYKITFDLNIKNVPEKEINKLIKCLDCEKSAEVEEFYWELAGECDTDTELSIVGMMIDEYNIAVDDHHLNLVVYRYKN